MNERLNLLSKIFRIELRINKQIIISLKLIAFKCIILIIAK